MRLSRRLLLTAAASGLVFVSACERSGDAPVGDGVIETAPAMETTGVPASDELAGLSAAPTGIAFWTHPNVAFNALIVVASETGLASYNMEDGNEVSTVPGLSFNDVALSYAGLGRDADGLVAALDSTANVFRFYAIDNGSRLFEPLSGGPQMRGNVRGFCMGRAKEASLPTLFTLTRGQLRIFNLAVDAKDAAAGVTVSDETTVSVPETITDCAVDSDGVVILGGSDGALYRLAGEQSFAAPFATAGVGAIADLSVLSSADGAGQIVAMGSAGGAIELFDREDGHSLGAISVSATDEIAAVGKATAMGASGANLGGLYRDGALGVGVIGNAPSIRLVPANGIANALTLTPLAPANPRGEQPAKADPDTLIINPAFPD